MSAAGFVPPQAICRHAPGDPACGSHSARMYESLVDERRERNDRSDTPDATQYRITDAFRVGTHLVVKVRYPNCSKCAYEGDKVMVFLDVTEYEALRWREIDPHFREDQVLAEHRAPSPAARFPASHAGWEDALEYARAKASRT